MADNGDIELPEWAQLIDAGGPRERCVASLPMGDLTIHTHGGQVMSWVCQGRERLWTSATAEYAVGKGIRGGVPVVFPWFAHGPDGAREPNHGPARLARWRLAGWGTNSPSSAAGMDLTLGLDAEDLAGQAAAPDIPGASDWPAGTRVTVTAALGIDTLSVVLTLLNDSDEPVSCEAALHTYLAVSDVEDVLIDGLDGVRFYDKVSRREDVTDDPIPFGEEIDRIYEPREPVVLRDGIHSLRVGGEVGGVDAAARPSQTVVWNPGRDKGPGLADVSDWRAFVCIESAAIGVDAIVIPPAGGDDGQAGPGIVTLTQTLTVLPPTPGPARAPSPA